MMPNSTLFHFVLNVVAATWLFIPQDADAQVADRATAQTIYVPSYSRVLTKEGRSEPMASTLVVHNVDPEIEITVSTIDYYDRAGQLLKNFITETVVLAPFESTYALVPIDSVGDGIGANFLVAWSSQTPSIPPIVEAVMVGGNGTQGISLSSRGKVISQLP